MAAATFTPPPVQQGLTWRIDPTDPRVSRFDGEGRSWDHAAGTAQPRYEVNPLW